MALLHIPLSQIGERELQRLIQAKVAEARDIEYKSATYGGSEGDHAEWLADVSSFANTAGGDLIIGMKARAGAPTAFAPLTIDFDAEILRLEHIARSNLQPRVQVHSKSVRISAGGTVLVIRIPRSFNPPHRIVRNGKGQNRFWARSSAGKYEPSVDELRVLFTLAPQLMERIRDFRVDRVAKIAARALPISLMHDASLILHVVPFSSFDPGALLSLAEVYINPHPFAPIGSHDAKNPAVNFDGMLIPSNDQAAATTHRAYVQVYRTGRLEAVDSLPRNNSNKGLPPLLSSIAIEGKVLMTLTRFVKGLQALHVQPPYAVMISLIGVKGMRMTARNEQQIGWERDDVHRTLIEDQFHFGEVILETVPNSVQECGVMLRPFIEQLANTAGEPTSSSFGPQGEYLHHFRGDYFQHVR